MFTKYKQKAQTVLVCNDDTPLHVSTKANIILSPSFYWFKKVSLPLTSVHKVKKLLPSLFESSVVSGQYSYSAYKEGEFFYAFAYDDRQIINTLAKKGVSLAQVEGIYFAQSVLKDIKNSIVLDEEKALHVKDDVVITLPREWVSDTDVFDVQKISALKHKIKLKEYGHLVKSSKLYVFAALLVAFVFITALKYFQVHQNFNAIEEKRSELFSKYALLPTMMQNRSVLSDYETTYNKQIKLRNAIAKLLGTLPDGVKIRSLTIDSQTLSAKLQVETASISRVSKLLQTQKGFEVKVYQNSLHVKVAL